VVGILLLALAVSVDSLAVGLTYGLRQIVLSKPAQLVIASVSGLAMWLSMAFGSVASRLMPGAAGGLGGALLACLGLWHLAAAWRRGQALRSSPTGAARLTDDAAARRRLLSLRLSSLGLVIEILQDPSLADADRSGRIDQREAFALGLALGLDALVAGVGAAMAGASFWAIPATALGCWAFVAAGQRLALSMAHRAPGGLRWPVSGLPGMILLSLGLARLGLGWRL
jgi:putative sporulation protein YtaF